MQDTTIHSTAALKSGKSSYSTRLILLSIAGIHLPLIGIIAYVYFSNSVIQSSDLISVMLIFTVVATLITLPFINKTLSPIRSGTKALEEYYLEEKVPVRNTLTAVDDDIVLSRLQRTIISLHAHIEEKRDLSLLLSQDLRQPFSQMMGIFEIIKLEDDHSKIDAYCNQMIVEGTKRLKFLEHVLEELNASNTEESTASATAHEEKSYIMVNELINNAVEKVQVSAQNKAVSLMIACKCNPVLEVDEARLINAVADVLANSIKYSFPKGMIKIKAEMDKEFLHITVSDKGMGFSAEEQKSLFKRFAIGQMGTQGEEATSFPLYGAKQAIENEGGTVKIESAGRNEGSTFKIVLPIRN